MGGIQRSRVSGLRMAQRVRYRALAEPTRILNVPLKDIRYKLSDRKLLRKYYPGVILSSFEDQPLYTWDDITRNNTKRRAIRDRYLRGVPWEESDLFAWYAGQFQSGASVRGCRSMEDLLNHYRVEIEPLFESIKAEGIRPPGAGSDTIFLHVGSSGEWIYGSNGNHRWFMAELLSIETMPFGVFARHARWQGIREGVQRGGRAYLEANGLGEHASHPDLSDLLT